MRFANAIATEGQAYGGAEAKAKRIQSRGWRRDAGVQGARRQVQSAVEALRLKTPRKPFNTGTGQFGDELLLLALLTVLLA
jgi:hypothetical protein